MTHSTLLTSLAKIRSIQGRFLLDNALTFSGLFTTQHILDVLADEVITLRDHQRIPFRHFG